MWKLVFGLWLIIDEFEVWRLLSIIFSVGLNEPISKQVKFFYSSLSFFKISDSDAFVGDCDSSSILISSLLEPLYNC